MIYNADYFINDPLEVINHVNLFRDHQSWDNTDTKRKKFLFSSENRIVWHGKY